MYFRPYHLLQAGNEMPLFFSLEEAVAWYRVFEPGLKVLQSWFSRVV